MPSSVLEKGALKFGLQFLVRQQIGVAEAVAAEMLYSLVAGPRYCFYRFLIKVSLAVYLKRIHLLISFIFFNYREQQQKVIR
mgnify:CR=1 FL=1